MATLILMRHANAELTSPGMRDFDRPLSAAGWVEAGVATQLLKASNIAPTTVFCSPAKRTSQTLEVLRKIIDIKNSAIELHHQLYAGDVAQYKTTLPKLKTDGVCMFIGHNPMIEHFAFDLVQNSNPSSPSQLKMGFPTAAIAVFELDDMRDTAQSRWRLTHFFDPNAA